MRLFRKVLGLFRSTEEVSSTFVTPSPLAIIEAEFRHQLLVSIQANFPSLQSTLENDEICIEPTGLTLETKVFEQTHHPNVVVCTLGVRLFHPVYFPDSIVECLAGYGTDEISAVCNGACIYVDGILATVIEALQGRHDPALDLTLSEDNIWHPIIGDMQVQGARADLTEELNHKHLFELLKPSLLTRLESKPFHWLKVYASRQTDGEFIGDCLFDNQPWEEGLQILKEEVIS